MEASFEPTKNESKKIQGVGITYVAIVGDSVLAEYKPFIVKTILGVLLTELCDLRLREVSGYIVVGTKVFIQEVCNGDRSNLIADVTKLLIQLRKKMFRILHSYLTKSLANCTCCGLSARTRVCVSPNLQSQIGCAQSSISSVVGHGPSS
jgi:hypothetical protein